VAVSWALAWPAESRIAQTASMMTRCEALRVARDVDTMPVLPSREDRHGLESPFLR